MPDAALPDAVGEAAASRTHFEIATRVRLWTCAVYSSCMLSWLAHSAPVFRGQGRRTAPEASLVAPHSRSRLASVVAALALAACAPASKEAGAPHASHASDGGMRGYGVPGVDGPTLRAMLGRCEAVERLPQRNLPAIEQTDILRRCAQLRRTMGTQPGNSVRAGP